MPNSVGFVDDTVGLAHHNFLAHVKAQCEAAGWTTLRYDTGLAIRELILRAPGYTSPDGPVYAYVGMRTYESVPSDYYNLSVATFTGYVSGNTFTTQPGYTESGIPAHNQRIDYWLTINARRLAFGLKVGTPVYQSGYAGFCLPYATPRQYPYPIVCAGALDGIPATRYSDTSHSFAWKGSRNNLRLRSVTGSYLTPQTWPWNNGRLAAAQGIRPADTYYPLPRVVMCDAAPNVYGELDGICYMTGFDNVVENTLVIGGLTYIVIQDVWRTGFIDYMALRLDT